MIREEAGDMDGDHIIDVETHAAESPDARRESATA